MAKRISGAAAKSERAYLSEQFEKELPEDCWYMVPSIREKIEYDFAEKTTGGSYCLSHNEIIDNLKSFKPTWLESFYQKDFPKKRSCILVGYMTDIAYIPREWVQKIIDRIVQDNQERENAGLLLHVFQFLTKDPTVYHEFKWPLNCWLGTTILNQKQFSEKAYYCKKAAYEDGFDFRRISYLYLEPVESEIDFKDQRSFDWVIVGGGPDTINPDWVRSIRDQCQAAGIPFYFKQWGAWLHDNQVKLAMFDHFYLTGKKLENGYWKTGKKKAANLLDGEKWEQFPEVK